MRIKKGFTLAEILIVLMVIGIIATLTIPGLMKGVQEANFKTSYKKAYNTIVNWAAMSSVSGELPAKGTSGNNADVYISLARNLSVKGFIPTYAPDQGSANNLTTMVLGTTIKDSSGTDVQVGATTGNKTAITTGAAFAAKPPEAGWIITEDNFAYAVYTATGGTNCKKKLDINSSGGTDTTMASAACFVIVVDVNGLNKTPNLLEPQMNKSLENATATQTLTGDQYYIFLGTDGATAGHPKKSLTGRLIGDVKN